MKWVRFVILTLIVAAAFFVRLWFVGKHQYVFPDSRNYLTLAQTILFHRDYADHGLYAFRMPGYPYFLAMIMHAWPTTPPVMSVLWVQCGLGALTIIPIYSIARRLGAATALLACATVAVDPLQVGFTATVLTETLFTLLFILAIWTALKITDNDHGLWWLMLGVLWGIGVYVRPSCVPLLVPLALWAGFVHVIRARRSGQSILRPLGRALAGTVLSFAVMSLVLLPWHKRASERFGPHTWMTTAVGLSLYESVFPTADGSAIEEKVYLYPGMETLGEAALNDEWTRRGWNYVFSEPGRMAQLAVVKFTRLWSPWLNATEFKASSFQTPLILWTIPIYVLALAALVSRKYLWRPHWALAGVLILPPLYFSALHALIVGSLRYRTPIMPLIDILAAAGAVMILRMCRGSRRAAANQTPPKVSIN